MKKPIANYTTKKSKNRYEGETKLKIIIFLIILIFVSKIFASCNEHQYTITITDKERVTQSGDSKYLVFGTDHRNNVVVLENTDNLLRGKFNSSNIQGGLTVGNTYRITVIGFRLPFFSWYENIIKIEKVK